MTLTEFLRARIDEDEAVAREAIAARAAVEFTDPSANNPDHGIYAGADLPVPAVVVGPERVLAECEAKRRIVELHAEQAHVNEYEGGFHYCAACGTGGVWDRDAVEWPCPTLRLLALPYAGDPDYDEAWRP
mgnify:CR=1 FL=1